MRRIVEAALVLCVAVSSFTAFAPAGSAASYVPAWARPALRYVVQSHYVAEGSFRANSPMPRQAFGELITKAFGGGYSKTDGSVTALEMSAVLVRALHYGWVAQKLDRMSAPGGWRPRLPWRFGYEVVARTLGLRHNRDLSENLEASSYQPISQADVIYAVWRAKTSANTWAMPQLESFSLPAVGPVQKQVLEFAFRLVGNPYVWGGEWIARSYPGYPYGAQAHGGFDCSGFSWYVLKAPAPGWSPRGRPYRGWSLTQRVAADIAGAATPRIPYSSLRAADLVFFAPHGSSSMAASVYHVGIYIGRGWMIDSSGSKDGPSLDYIGPGSWYRSQFAWGRRVIPS
jgi:cell wall-associated NlpC family hydrolase